MRNMPGGDDTPPLSQHHSLVTKPHVIYDYSVDRVYRSIAIPAFILHTVTGDGGGKHLASVSRNRDSLSQGLDFDRFKNAWILQLNLQQVASIDTAVGVQHPICEARQGT